MVLTIDTLPGEDGQSLQDWLEPIAKAVAVEVVVSDDADAFKNVADGLMSGPSGSGKTLLVRALPLILPRVTIGEALEVTRVYSVARMLPPGQSLLRHSPFRAPGGRPACPLPL